MASTDNLKPLNERTQRERKEIARLGAKASNKVQANKKLLKEAAKVLLTMPVSKELKTELKKYRLSTSDCNYAMALVVAQLKNALQGDTRAFNAIRDIIGEKPKEKEEAITANDGGSVIINVQPARKDEEETHLTD